MIGKEVIDTEPITGSQVKKILEEFREERFEGCRGDCGCLRQVDRGSQGLHIER